MVLVRSWKEVWFLLDKGDLDLVLQRAEVGIWDANGGGIGMGTNISGMVLFFEAFI